MLKKIWTISSLLFALAFASPLSAETYAHYFSVGRDATGAAIAGATVSVKLAGTSTSATLYNDGSGSGKSNPFLSDSLGNYDFWIHPGLYKITVTKIAVGTFTVDNVAIGTQSHVAIHETGGSDVLDLSLIPGTVAGSQIASGAVTNAKVSNSAGIVESKLALNFATHANTNDPSTQQKAALGGTSGTPDGSNKYATNSDPRLTNSRAPTAHHTSHEVGGSDPISVAISQITGAGSDLSQSFALNTHASRHQDGGADEISVLGLSGLLADPQKIVVKRGGTTIGTRPTINFIEGGNTTLSVTDNSGANRVDVQVDASALSGVSSVDMSVPSWLTVAGNPITTTGTLAVTATSGQTANRFLATPNGSTGAVSLRAIVAADVPTLNQNTSGTAAGLSATLAVASGGTNLTSASDDSVMVGNGTTWQSKAISNCTDTAGNHLNYTASTNTFSCGTSGGGGSNHYSPDIEPTSGGISLTESDSFDGGYQQTWRWGNQGSSVETAAMDTAYLTTPTDGGRNIRARWITAPAAGDMTITTKVTPIGFAGNFNSGGITILSGGTEGSPTELWQLGVMYNGGPLQLLIQRYTDYSTQSGTAAATTFVTNDLSTFPPTLWLLVSYVNSTKVVTLYVSRNGMDWWALGTTGTLANAPISIGRYVESQSGNPATMRFETFRTFTSGAALTNPFQVSQ